MTAADLILFLVNVLYATSYTVSQIVLVDVGPATLGLARLVIGASILMPWALARPRPAEPRSWTDRWSIFWMGVLGFGAAFALGNWGLARSTASNAALLITVEPASLIYTAGGGLLILTGLHLTVKAGRVG